MCFGGFWASFREKSPQNAHSDSFSGRKPAWSGVFPRQFSAGRTFFVCASELCAALFHSWQFLGLLGPITGADSRTMHFLGPMRRAQPTLLHPLALPKPHISLKNGVPGFLKSRNDLKMVTNQLFVLSNRCFRGSSSPKNDLQPPKSPPCQLFHLQKSPPINFLQLKITSDLTFRAHHTLHHTFSALKKWHHSLFGAQKRGITPASHFLRTTFGASLPASHFLLRKKRAFTQIGRFTFYFSGARVPAFGRVLACGQFVGARKVGARVFCCAKLGARKVGDHKNDARKNVVMVTKMSARKNCGRVKFGWITKIWAHIFVAHTFWGAPSSFSAHFCAHFGAKNGVDKKFDAPPPQPKKQRFA